jgi:predicted metal-dependent peptidase
MNSTSLALRVNAIQAIRKGTTQGKDDSKKFADLIGPMVAEEDRKARDKLVLGRVGLLLRSSFYGNLATRLKLVNADEWCGTAATDGRHFYYNARFILMLKQREVEFLFGHEVLHVVYDHFGRRNDRDPMIWNFANDFCVNGDLIKYRVGERITTVPCLYDAKYDGWSSEEVYDDLMQNAKKISISDLLDKVIDQHLDQEGDSEGKDGKGPAKMSKEERDALRDELKEAIVNAAKQAEAGSLPKGVQRIIEDLTEPKMNWRELIRMQLESTIKSDFTWMRASRRGWHMDAVMPGMRNEDMIDIVVFLDASGSIGPDQLRDFLSEIKGIMETFGAYKIHVITFDTEVYNPKVYTSENLENIADYELSGGGGTDFDCMFRYMKEENIEPKRLIVFTDGYPCGSWGDENYCDTLWVIHGNTSVKAPWGTFAYYDEAK